MKKAITKMNKEGNRKNLFRGLVGGICLSFLLYGFGITRATISTAEAQVDSGEVSELQTKIAELEIEYFEIINTLTLDEAEELGMVEKDDIYYARINEITTVAYNL